MIIVLQRTIICSGTYKQSETKVLRNLDSKRMKIKDFWRLLMIISIAFLCCGIYSCGDDEDEFQRPTQPPVEKPTDNDEQPTEEFSLTFSIKGAGTGTASSPVVVEAGDTLDITINQRSRYTDPNGSTYVYNPQASIKLFTDSTAVCTENFQTLTDVKEIYSRNTEREDGKALQRQTLQTFSIGGKKISFDLMHEIYRHVNSEKTTIEMPYIQVNAAEYGAVNTEEEAQTRAGSAPVSVTNIRIKPRMPVTRGAIVDSTMYDVSVAFNVELQTVHAPEPQSKTLSFEIHFPAIIESTTEYPDPTLDFSYSREILGGTTSTASPFIYSSGETLALKWVGNTKYDYFTISNRSMEEISYEATANADLIASKDTVWVEDVEELEKVVPGRAETSVTDVQNAKLYTGKKSFTLGGEQKIDFNWNYQTYQETEVEGVKVTWPYLTLSEPQLVSVQKTEQPNAKIAGKKAKVYELSLRFRQDVSAENAPQPMSETVEYIVKYIGVHLLPEEKKLLEVKYRKAYEWYEPHDNLPIRNQYILYKDSIFSDGSTRTAESHSQTCAMDFVISPSHIGFEDVLYADTLYHRYDGNDILFHINKHEWNLSYLSPMITSTKTGVPDLSKLSVGEPMESNYDGEPCTNPEAYFYGTTNDRFNPENPQNGWYVGKFAFASDIELNYAGIPIRQYALILIWYDRFAYTDGKMFDFLDYKATLEFNLKQENTTMPDGSPAIVFTHEGIIHWCGKDFYHATVDSVYQRK